LLVTLKNDRFISYTLPGKIQSYMAAGKPIIGAINGEAKQVIEASGCGLCCPAEDYQALADIIRQFVCEPEKHSEFSLSSRKYYESHFDKSVFLQRTLKTLRELKDN
jgi:glycosyltransferase involved in cell wall biosynthesis